MQKLEIWKRVTLGMLSALAVIALTSFAVMPSGRFVLAGKRPVRLLFKLGTLSHLTINEVLKITMHFPQVESGEVRPSTRITNYDFTERIDSVSSDGSALIAVTLDSFKTKIVIGDGRSAENYFDFNSNNDDDLKTKFRDIRALPRAQFLGQTLRFTVAPDGQIRNFENLSRFHQLVMGKDYDYDFVHAMLSLTDSLRLGQLFEHGFGAIAAIGGSSREPFHGPSTTTEIPITRTLTALGEKHVRNGDSIRFFARYSDAPSHIDYLEGLAANLGVSEFSGGGSGYAVESNGVIVRSEFRDTSSMKLQVDIETVPEEIVRYVQSIRTPISLMHGIVNIQEKKEHTAVPKIQNPEPDSDATVIDANGHVVNRPPNVQR